jgi:hypothetical protein
MMLSCYDCSYSLSIECAEGEVLSLVGFSSVCVGSFSIGRSCLPFDVRFSPKATDLLRGSEILALNYWRPVFHFTTPHADTSRLMQNMSITEIGLRSIRNPSFTFI